MLTPSDYINYVKTAWQDFLYMTCRPMWLRLSYTVKLGLKKFLSQLSWGLI